MLMNKIFYIANIRLPTEKAHGIQIMEMCNAFAEQGYEVELIVPNRKTVVNGEIKEDNAFDYYDVPPNFQITRLWSLDFVKFGRFGFMVQSISFALYATGILLFERGFFYTRDEIVAVLLRLQGKRVIWESHMGHDNLLTWLIVKLKVLIVVITNHLKNLYVEMGVVERNVIISSDGVDLD